MISNSQLPRGILFLHNYENNGANRFAYDLIRCLSSEWSFEVISPYEGVRQSAFSKLGCIASVVSYSELESFFKKNESHFDLCVVNTLLNASFIGMIRSFGLPVHLTVHETMNLDQAADIFSKLWGITAINFNELVKGLALADTISFPSAETLRRYEQFIKKDQGRLIYNGLDAQNFSLPTPKSNISTLKLLQVGTISPKKNQLQSLKVLVELKKIRPALQVQLTLVGARDFRAIESQYVQEIKEFAKVNNVEDSLHIYPNVEDVSAFYLNSNILIHPALSETFPYVILEAMYFGMPVVASKIGGIPEQIIEGSQGYLHDPEDTLGFVRSILKLFEDKNHYNQISILANKRVKDNFEIERMTSSYRVLFSELYSFRTFNRRHFDFPSLQFIHEKVLTEESSKKLYTSKIKERVSKITYNIGEKLSKRKVQAKYYELLMQKELSHARALIHQKQLLFNTLKHCEQSVPYYKNLFQKNNFYADLILKDIKYLEKLPFLTKNDIYENFNLIQEKTNGEIHYRYSNGSTGVSRPVLYSTEDLDWTAAVSLYSRFLFGKTPSDPEIHIATPSQVKRTFISRCRENLKNLAMNRKVILNADLCEHSLEDSISQLRDTAAVLVQGQPSIFYALACHLISKYPENLWPKIKIFESTGEVLDPLKVNAITRVFRCKVINRYGLAEFGGVGLGLKDPFKIEVFPSIVYPESINGEIVLTSLRRQLMPLIRYKTGDLGTVVHELDSLYIHGLYGRVFETVQLNGKIYSTKQLQDMILSFPDVIDFQVVQSPLEVELSIALRKNANVEFICSRLQSMFNDAMNVKIKEINAFIRRGNSSKFRHVVNLND